MNELIILFLMMGVFGLVFGVVYPATMIIYYKLIKHSKKNIAQILDEI